VSVNFSSACKILRSPLLIIGVLVAIITTSGCILAPAIESFKRAGVTEADRQKILGENVEHFNQARFWGKPQKALLYSVPESQPALSKTLRKSKSEEQIVDAQVEHIEFSDNAYKALIDVKVRAFKVPVYIVRDRIERQHWVFSLGDGWRIEKLEIDVQT